MKKTGILILVLILALGAIGVGYAAWSQTLNITGTANTATFEIGMTYGTPTMPGDASSTTSIGVTDNPISAPNQSTDCAGFSVAITNATPGIYTVPSITITNDSSVPFRVTTSVITGDPELLSWITGNGPFTAGDVDLAIGPGASMSGDLTITVPDTITAQGKDYSFSIDIIANQL